MDIAREEAGFASAAARGWLKDTVPVSFHELAVAAQRHCIRLQLHGLDVAPTYKLVEKLRLEEGVPVSLRPGIRVCRNAAGKVSLLPETHNPPEHDPSRLEIAVDSLEGGCVFVTTFSVRASLPKAQKREDFLSAGWGGRDRG